MEQFRQIGEVLGSLNALMLLQDETQINRRQCSLLFDIFGLAFNTIAEEIRLNLRLDEKNTKWTALESPLKELQRVFKDGEVYVKQSMDRRDWWVKAINFHQNKDCVESHIHNLLCHFPVVIEAIETAGEISGHDKGEMQRRRIAIGRKYDKEWMDPKLFQFRFGKQYLIPRDICSRFEYAWREDRMNLVDALKEKMSSGSATRAQQRLADLLIKKMIGSEGWSGKLFPSSILYGGDYVARRRLGGQYKEIQWLGDTFVMRNSFVDVEKSGSEISTLLSLAHPNILQCLCGFYDEEKKEVLLVQEVINKDLNYYISGSRKKIVFGLPVMIDLMFQIARGMEYLHSHKMYHGDLNHCNIFLKPRNSSEGCYYQLKISGYGLSTGSNLSSPMKPIETNSFIWYAPEVLQEQEQSPTGNFISTKYTEKADVYSFGMICFEIVTGKVPFQDTHLQGEKVSRNIRAGERPLFPHPAPKYLVNLTKRCWHADPNQRPSFSSICRILRYIKKFLVMNPDHDQPESKSPVTDYCEIETWFSKKFTSNRSLNPSSVAQIPFQMFAYRLAEKDNTIISNTTDNSGELSSEEPNSSVEDPLVPASDAKSVTSDEIPEKRSTGSDPTPRRRSIRVKVPDKKILQVKKISSTTVKAKKSTGTTNGKPTPTPLPRALPRIQNVKVIRDDQSVKVIRGSVKVTRDDQSVKVIRNDRPRTMRRSLSTDRLIL